MFFVIIQYTIVCHFDPDRTEDLVALQALLITVYTHPTTVLMDPTTVLMDPTTVLMDPTTVLPFTTPTIILTRFIVPIINYKCG